MTFIRCNEEKTENVFCNLFLAFFLAQSAMLCNGRALIANHLIYVRTYVRISEKKGAAKNDDDDDDDLHAEALSPDHGRSSCSGSSKQLVPSYDILGLRSKGVRPTSGRKYLSAGTVQFCWMADWLAGCFQANICKMHAR